MKNKLFTLIGLLFFFCSIQSCGQNKSNTKADNMDRTATPQQGMMFSVQYENAYCNYEILLNDVPLATYAGQGDGFTLTKELNQYILKPGKQDITIKLFPQKHPDSTVLPTLTKDSKLKIIIKKKKEPTSLVDIAEARDKNIPIEWELLTFETPVPAKDAPFAEYTTSFNVSDKDMSWHIKGWSESKDLRHEPDLKAEVDSFYQNFKNILATKNQQAFVDLLKTSIHEEALSKPWFGEDLENALTKEMFTYAKEDRKFIDDCQHSELKYYGNGRLVTLVCTDAATSGNSPLVSKTTANALPKAHVLYLHKPKGSDKLEIIR